MDEVITKFYIEIKNSLTLALECESKAAFHHFNIGQKLAILYDRLQNDIPKLKNILKEGLSMDLRYEYYTKRLFPHPPPSLNLLTHIGLLEDIGTTMNC